MDSAHQHLDKIDSGFYKNKVYRHHETDEEDSYDGWENSTEGRQDNMIWGGELIEVTSEDKSKEAALENGWMERG